MKVAVLSRDKSLYSTSRLVQAGKEQGVDMVVIDHLKCHIVMEKATPSIYRGQVRLDDIDAIIPRVGESVTAYGADIIEHFEMMGVYSTVSASSLIRSRNKLTTLQRLTRYGVAIPHTVFTDYMSDTGRLTELLGEPPWIIKLLEGTQGLGIILVENGGAAGSVIEGFQKLKARLVVQEFVAECAASDVRALVIGGEVVGAIKRSSTHSFRSHGKKLCTTEVIQLTSEEEKAVLRATLALEIDIAAVDLLQSERGPLVIGVDSSPGFQSIEEATGIDIAGRIISYVISKESAHAHK